MSLVHFPLSRFKSVSMLYLLLLSQISHPCISFYSISLFIIQWGFCVLQMVKSDFEIVDFLKISASMHAVKVVVDFLICVLNITLLARFS